VIITGWRGLFLLGDLPGRWNAVPTFPGISIFVFVPLALTYWQLSRWYLEFSDEGVAGLSSRGIIAFSAVEKWAINGRTLLLWPVAGEAPVQDSQQRKERLFFIRRGSVTYFWVRPGVPKGTYWAAVAEDDVPAISALLTERIGPSGASL